METVDELKLEEGDQLYVYGEAPPEGFAVSVLELPLQMVVGLAVGAADGLGFTVMVTAPLVTVQAPDVTLHS